MLEKLAGLPGIFSKNQIHTAEYFYSPVSYIP
jgi:hypothetical protein